MSRLNSLIVGRGTAVVVVVVDEVVVEVDVDVVEVDVLVVVDVEQPLQLGRGVRGSQAIAPKSNPGGCVEIRGTHHELKF